MQGKVCGDSVRSGWVRCSEQMPINYNYGMMRAGRHNIAVKLQQTKLWNQRQQLNRKLGGHFSGTWASDSEVLERAGVGLDGGGKHADTCSYQTNGPLAGEEL
jgi:hypothetical protein